MRLKYIPIILFLSAGLAANVIASTNSVTQGNITYLGKVVVIGSALSKYRPDTVNSGSFTDIEPELLPSVVDTLTSDFIEEHNPTDLHDLMRYVPGIETGGKSLLIRQPGTFSIRGMGGTEPTIDGVTPIGSGAGLFMDTYLIDRVEIAKGPVGALSGGAGSVQNNSGAGGSVNLLFKSALLDEDETTVQFNTSIGNDTQRYRGMADVNETVYDGRGAIRVVTSADYYEPVYINNGSQDGARARESYSVAPSFIFQASDEITLGVKSLLQYTDQPSYIGIPVWKGKPAGGYDWHESSCRENDRSHFKSVFINPWVDWQMTDNWLIKAGASFIYSEWDQTTREPYNASSRTPAGAVELQNFYNTGIWSSGKKYMTSDFSESKRINRNYNAFIRSIYTSEFSEDGKSTFLVQPDVYYRESTSGFGTPITRYGITLQEIVEWNDFAILAGLRTDRFEANSYTTDTGAEFPHQGVFALSPRGGLSYRLTDGVILFGNLSQTRTPTLGYQSADGSTPDDPWKATQYEGGIRISPLDALWLSISGYHIEQENTPVAEDVNGETYYYFEGKNRSRGMEASISGDLTENWTILAMYSWNKYTDCNVAKGKKGRDFERHPAHTISLNTSYRFNEGALEDVVIGAAFRYRSMNYATMRGTYVNENLRFSASAVFDINMEVPFSKFGGSEDCSLTLGVRNLFDEKYFESARHYYECLAGEPRTFELGIKAKF